MESRVDLYARIRRDFRVEELSIRELSRRHGVARETVRAALLRAEPLPRKVPERVATRLAPFKAAIDGMLTEDRGKPTSSSCNGFHLTWRSHYQAGTDDARHR